MLTYSPKDTVIHRLNPASKVTWLAGVVILSLVFDNPLYLLLLFLSTLPMVVAAKSTRQWLPFMKLTLFLCAFIIAFNAIFSFAGEHVILRAPTQIPLLGYPALTIEGILFGVGMSIRLAAIISAFTVLTFTVNPDDLMLQMVKLRLPYKSILVISMATRFFPVLLKDAETITDVHRSRGIELEKGGLVGKIRNRVPIVTALLAKSLDRAVQVAEAMESRGFGAVTKRTFYKAPVMGRVEYTALTLAISPVIFGVAIRLLNYGYYQYYPTLQALTLTQLDLLAMIILATLLISLTLLPVKLGVDCFD